MRLAISHSTTYHYDGPVPYGLQELRLHPRTLPGQRVLEWETRLEGATSEVVFEDEHANLVELISFDSQTSEIVVTAAGEVETEDTAGVVSRHLGHAPLWLFRRTTDLTNPGERIRQLVDGLPEGDDIGRLHALSSRILDRVAYETGTTDVTSTAEQAVAAGHGVCQDHSHIFVSAARLLGYPARYISGYLAVDGGSDQDASHAWAQAWVDQLGWVGFDVSNGISPDERYVQVATGLDYGDAAPIWGVRFGQGVETLHVDLQVQQ